MVDYKKIHQTVFEETPDAKEVLNMYIQWINHFAQVDDTAAQYEDFFPAKVEAWTEVEADLRIRGIKVLQLRVYDGNEGGPSTLHAIFEQWPDEAYELRCITSLFDTTSQMIWANGEYKYE